MVTSSDLTQVDLLKSVKKDFGFVLETISLCLNLAKNFAKQSTF